MFPDERLSKDFKRSEFRCRGIDCCGGSAPVHPDLIMLLQKIRDYAENEITIISGFRCCKHNATIPTSRDKSYHCKGMAADITCEGMPVECLYYTAFAAIDELGYGWTYANKEHNFVHVDCRR